MSHDDGLYNLCPCDECGEDILAIGQEYHDGQRVVCPDCMMTYYVCCDSENEIHLHAAEGDEGGDRGC